MHRKQKFDENLKDKVLKRGMLVLRYNNRFDTRKDKKFMVRWEGPFLIYKKYTNGGHMEHEALHHGDLVQLLTENKIVAVGRVHTTEPSDFCHGELLGNGFCSISIDTCLNVEAYLPFPTVDASMVNEVVGGFVKWDMQNVIHVKEVEEHGHTDGATSPNDFILESNGTPNSGDGIRLRESWRERKVMLWSKENTEVLGNGVLLLALPYEVINFELLGEEDVGIVVNKSYNESARTCTSDDLDCINLVRWPIKRVTFEDGTPLIWEELIATSTLEDATTLDEYDEFIAGQKSIFVKKRTYYLDDADNFGGLEELNDHYCGPLSKRPKDAFQPAVDVKKGDFVLVQPSDPIYPIWLGVAQSEVDMNMKSHNFKKIIIQYWAPVCGRQNASDQEMIFLFSHSLALGFSFDGANSFAAGNSSITTPEPLVMALIGTGSGCFASELKRKLQEAEAREDALQRERLAFKSQQVAYEAELAHQRQSLLEWESKLQKGQERLLEGQIILNWREDALNKKESAMNKIDVQVENDQQRAELAYSCYQLNWVSIEELLKRPFEESREQMPATWGRLPPGIFTII
ncbi:hypothetical protein L7F22_037926 [Adiantum nelumboides]|nr:hypothetical protein [Adiantum nelumboides]